ncbi:hypothetical protein [Pleurocapsa sp. PCC 7327]|nr:hypothetical protein [Pleurocapsa sp. PCC 7327]
MALRLFRLVNRANRVRGFLWIVKKLVVEDGIAPCQCRPQFRFFPAYGSP